MLYKWLTFGNTEINFILGQDIADSSAQQYNSILRHIECSHWFWSIRKSQECRMWFPNWTLKRLVFNFFNILCVCVKNHASCNYSCQEFGQSKIVKSSMKPHKRKNASSSTVLSNTLLHSEFSADFLCHVLKHQQGFLQQLELFCVSHPSKDRFYLVGRLKAIITWHRTWGTEITEYSCGWERRLMLGVQWGYESRMTQFI